MNTGYQQHGISGSYNVHLFDIATFSDDIGRKEGGVWNDMDECFSGEGMTDHLCERMAVPYLSNIADID